MNKTLAKVIHATWGLPQSLAGLAVMAMVGRKSPHYPFRSAVVTEWPLNRGLSLGPFIFLPNRYPRPLLVHEYGHTVQALILGPLYLPVIVLPSLTWAGVPALERFRRRHAMSYYRFYTERWANHLGERVCHERSMR